MSTQVLTDCKIYLGPYDLSGQHNSIALDYNAELLDETVFGGAGTRRYKPGLQQIKATGNIFWDDTSDLALFNRIGANREVLMVAPTGNAEDDRAFFTRGVNGTYNPASGEIGTLLRSTLDVNNANTPLVRGVISAAKGQRTTTGNSTGSNQGAVGATQKLYAGLFVFAVNVVGTLDVIIQSDTVGFPSPVTAITFATVTNSIGAEWQEVAGPITDTWFRSQWTIAGGGDYTFAVVLGIR